MNRATGRKLFVEQLESRRVLAGNISATQVGGNLTITGDDLGNRISVESIGTNAVQVRGFSDAGGPTRVNQLANGTRTFNNVTGDMSIRMRGGNDLVRVTNLVNQGTLLVDLGDGNDQAVTGRDTAAGNGRFGGSASGPLYVHGALRVVGGAGDDVTLQSDLEVKGNGLLNLGTGNDTLRMQLPPAGAPLVKYLGQLTIVPDAGNDTLNLASLLVDDDVVINDVSGRLNLTLRATDVRGNLTVFSDIVGDTVDIATTNVRDHLRIETEGGNDIVRVSATTSQLTAKLGDGSDRLELTALRADVLDVFGGLGNDLFVVRSVRAFDANFRGEGNTDTYQDSLAQPSRYADLNLLTIENQDTV